MVIVEFQHNSKKGNPNATSAWALKTEVKRQ